MSKVLEPHRVQVTPTYICENCESKHQESIEYVNKIGKILCDCGDVLSLKPITTFKVYPIYDEEKQTLETKPSIEQEQNFSINVYAENNDDEFLSLSEALDYLQDENDEIDNENALPDLPEWLTKTTNNKQQTSDKLPLFASKDVFQQSVDFLVSLGYKKTEAKKRAEKKAGLFNQQVSRTNFDEFAKSLLFNT